MMFLVMGNVGACTALVPAADLAAIAAEAPWGAAVVATAQGRARMRGVWGLLVKLGADLPAATPPGLAPARTAVACRCLSLLICNGDLHGEP